MSSYVQACLHHKGYAPYKRAEEMMSEVSRIVRLEFGELIYSEVSPYAATEGVPDFFLEVRVLSDDVIPPEPKTNIEAEILKTMVLKAFPTETVVCWIAFEWGKCALGKGYNAGFSGN